MEYPSNLNSLVEHCNMLEEESKRLRRQIRLEKTRFVFKNYKLLIKKRTIITFVVILFLAIGTAPYTAIPKSQTYVFNKTITVVSDTLKTHQKFLNRLGKLESGGNYKCVNSLGYCGKYQMGRSALVEIGLGGLSKEDFLNIPELQEIAMNLLLKKNKQFLQSYIGKYNSKTIKGIYVTESGMLAGAHAIGHGSVMKWLDSNGQVDPSDANGVKVSDRIKEFSGYSLKL